MDCMDLDDLLVAAGEAPPDARIDYRDPIAKFGAVAIARLSGQPWLHDPKYAAFAIQTIKRAGQLGARDEAIAALRNAGEIVALDAHRKDIESALQQLGVTPHAKPASRSTNASRAQARVLHPEELIVGHVYRRTELHDGGLGGNRQRGISYPAGGTHCLLFSDPSKAAEFGYRDRPVGEDGYRYFGAWDGPGDMSMTRGNKAVLARSPELFLFVASQSAHVYVGQFECSGHEIEKTVRDGAERNAIVFNLRRLTR